MPRAPRGRATTGRQRGGGRRHGAAGHRDWGTRTGDRAADRLASTAPGCAADPVRTAAVGTGRGDVDVGRGAGRAAARTCRTMPTTTMTGRCPRRRRCGSGSSGWRSVGRSPAGAVSLTALGAYARRATGGASTGPRRFRPACRAGGALFALLGEFRVRGERV